MAKILVSSFSNVTWTKKHYLDAYIEGFINCLVRCGNNVLSARLNAIFRDPATCVIYDYINQDKIKNKIKQFNPDLIITFNNVFPCNDILSYTDCPVAFFASDSPAFFSNQDLIKKYIDRYYFFNFSNDTIKSIPDWFPFVDPKRLILFGHATDLRRTDLNQDINVSFVGSLGNWDAALVTYFKIIYDTFYKTGNEEILQEINKVKDIFFEELDAFKEDPLKKSETPLPYTNAKFNVKMGQSAITLLTANLRFKLLSELTDLGLKIFSYPVSFPEVLLYNYELFRCFDYRSVVSLEHITDVYNRSKISLNLPHAHAFEGFSWRVCDILASGGLLLSDERPDLIRITKKYVDLPMYKSPAEARTLITKFLKDEAHRKEIVLACNEMVDKECRFEPRFKMMSEIVKINLFTDTPGVFEDFNFKEYVKEQYIKQYNYIKSSGSVRT